MKEKQEIAAMYGLATTARALKEDKELCDSVIDRIHKAREENIKS